MIEIENLGKRYLVRHQTGSRAHSTLRDALADGARAGLRRLWTRMLHQNLPSTDEHVREPFWALREISVQVAQGEVMGVIGPNGAGKSTLLKILSRITEPTEGRARLKGRVASLLEVGTGFHPELTGRENIFLNGAILGLTRNEIKRRFDEIVDFAEVANFLDTPVKRYSTGMQVRLAFAVAAHLEPEILIVDEVLAVGDASFQRKCLGRVQAASRSGRTVLFVSHNMAAVRMLCGRAIYLRAGRLETVGTAEEIVARYLGEAKGKLASRLPRPIVLADVEVISFQATPNPVTSGEVLTFHWCIRTRDGARIGDCAILLYSAEGVRVGILDLRGVEPARVGSNGEWVGEARVKRVPLVEGDYQVGLYLNAQSGPRDAKDLFTLSVEPRCIAKAFVEYPAVHRGFVELELDARPRRALLS